MENRIDFVPRNIPGFVQLSSLVDLLETAKNFIALTGDSGFGKTEWAKYFAHQQFKKKRINFCGFIQANSTESLQEGYLNLAKEIRVYVGGDVEDNSLYSLESIISLVNEALKKKFTRVLLIFDDANGFRNLKEKGCFSFEGIESKMNLMQISPNNNKFNSNNVTIVVTSACSTSFFPEDIRPSIEINLNKQITKEDCRNLFLHISQVPKEPANSSVVDNIVEKLGYTPFAISSAATLFKMKEGSSKKLSLDQFEKQIDKTNALTDTFQEAFSHEKFPPNKRVFVASLLAFEVLKEENEELFLIALPCGFIHQNFITKFLLDKFCKELRLTVPPEKAIKKLVDCGLLFEETNHSFFIHQTTQQALRLMVIDSLAKNDVALWERIKRSLLKSFRIPLAEDFHLYHSLYLHILSLKGYQETEIFQFSSREKIEFYFILMEMYQTMFDVEKVISFGDDCIISIGALHQNKENSDYATCRFYIAQAYRFASQYTVALEIDLEVLKIRNKINAPLLDIAVSNEAVGLDYLKNKQPDRAKPYLQEAVDIKRKLHSSDGEMIRTLLSLGSCLSKTEREKSIALRFFDEAYQCAKRIFHDKPHTLFAKAMWNLGNYYLEIGDSEKALKFINEGIKMNEQMYGDAAHPHLASGLVSRAKCYEAMGNYEIARQYSMDALEMRREIFKNNENHVFLSVNLYQLGQIEMKRGDNEAAETHLYESLEISKQRQQTQDVQRCYISIGECLYRQGKYEQARIIFEKALNANVEDASNNKNLKNTSRCHSSIAKCWRKSLGYDRAISHEKEGLSINEELSRDDPTFHEHIRNGCWKLAKDFRAIEDKENQLYYERKAKKAEEEFTKISRSNRYPQNRQRQTKFMDNPPSMKNERAPEWRRFSERSSRYSDEFHYSDSHSSRYNESSRRDSWNDRYSSRSTGNRNSWRSSQDSENNNRSSHSRMSYGGHQDRSRRSRGYY